MDKSGTSESAFEGLKQYYVTKTEELQVFIILF